ncbi:MAG: UDP-N-acetyl glucosamine 2-epimerase [Clostridia bacterium]|nr:UDP-N-acetyl glucosamine 2-epimerase [Clostridia bacterium]
MKVATVVGARPQFIKTALVSLELRKRGREILIHTGQHYDANMSANFFRELNIPQADYNLGIGSGTHGMQTGRMLEALEKVLLQEQPDWVVVYGDTNSTLAGALAAAKLHIPVAHVEAGLRSHNPAMPEEINRKLKDHISTVLFCPSKGAVENLKNEGFQNVLNNGELVDFESIERMIREIPRPVVLNVGDVMYDILVRTIPRVKTLIPKLMSKYPIISGKYTLVTIHRAENTDYRERLSGVVEALLGLDITVIWPLHPRTKKRLLEFNLLGKLENASNIILLEPVGYGELLVLAKNSRCIITDSGGVQKEAYMLGVPCLTCRDKTEWAETVELGWNRIVGLGAARLQETFPFEDLPDWHPNWFGDGYAARRIAWVLTKLRKSRGVYIND